MDIPATLRMLLLIGVPFSVDPLHCTTVPFSLAVAVNVRVEVMSARVVVVFITTVGLAVFVRVATKSKVTHCTDATSLQSKLLLVVPILLNSIPVLPERKGSTIHLRRNPWLTVQV